MMQAVDVSFRFAFDRYRRRLAMIDRLSTRIGRSWAMFLSLGAGLCILGCGNASMSGHVTFDKKPVVFGTLQVVGPGNSLRQCQIATDGSYALSDIPPGEVKVAIASNDPKAVGKNILHRQGVNPGSSSFDRITGWFPIPDKYSDFNNSGLNYTLTRGGNAIDIDLK
jgi:hypothetical protein